MTFPPNLTALAEQLEQQVYWRLPPDGINEPQSRRDVREAAAALREAARQQQGEIGRASCSWCSWFKTYEIWTDEQEAARVAMMAHVRSCEHNPGRSDAASLFIKAIERAEQAEAQLLTVTAERDEALRIAEHDDLKWLALDYQKRGDLLGRQNERVATLRFEADRLREELAKTQFAAKTAGGAILDLAQQVLALKADADRLRGAMRELPVIVPSDLSGDEAWRLNGEWISRDAVLALASSEVGMTETKDQ